MIASRFNPARARGARRPLLACACIALVLPLPAVAEFRGAADAFDGRMDTWEERVHWLAGYETRVPGTPAHGQAVDDLRSRLERLEPRIRLWEHRFHVVVPEQPGASSETESVLTVRDGPHRGDHRLYPFWPAGARLATTPIDGIATRPLYIGKGEWSEIPPMSIRGRIAVIEADSGEAWMRAFSAGAAALIVLENERMQWRDARRHLIPIPMDVPRFYLPDGPLADALRRGDEPDVHLYSRARWIRAEAANFYALVPGPEGAEPRKALTIVAPYDSMSVVPSRAPGADTAVDAAAALTFLEHLAANPPPRPVLVAFLDAYHHNQMGMRRMLGALSATPRDVRLHQREDEELIRREYRAAAELAERLGTEPSAIERLVTHEFEPLHRYIRDEINRSVLEIETVLHPLRLERYGATGDELESIEKRIEELNAQRQRLQGLRRHMIERREGDRRLEGGRLEQALELWKRAHDRVVGQFREALERIGRFDENERLRREVVSALGLRMGDEVRPLEYIVGINITDGGVAVGPQIFCGYIEETQSGPARDFTRWLTARYREQWAETWPESLRRSISIEPLSGLQSATSHNFESVALVTAAAHRFGTSAATWATIASQRARTDTPLDTADRLDWERLRPHIRATFAMLDDLVADLAFESTARITSNWRRARGSVVDRAPGEPLPQLPMPGYLVTLKPGVQQSGRIAIDNFRTPPGMRRLEFAFSGIDGRFFFEQWPVYSPAQHTRFVMQAYDFDAAGRVNRALDQGRAGRGQNTTVSLQSVRATPMRGMVFDTEELTLTDIRDPRFLQSLTGLVRDARDMGEPRRHNTLTWNDLLAAHLDPGSRWQLIMRLGITTNRAVLANVTDPATLAPGDFDLFRAMPGFRLSERPPLHPAHQAARDLFRLNSIRLTEYEQSGIQNRAIRQLQQRTEELLDRAEAALQVDDGKSYYLDITAALSNESRAYEATRDTANDVVRGAMFLLLLLVPFAYAMERLIIGSAIVYRQIAGGIAIFILMAFILWAFHPAFRISAQPLMVIMAFVVIFMSLMVLSVVFRKFESGIEELRSGRAESSGASTSRSGVLTTALRLGIANMRRRKLRTTLTGLTIVLITFVLLCFMSTGQYVGHRQVLLTPEAEYSGLLLRQPSLRAFPERMEEYTRTIYGADYPVASRWWWLNAGDTHWRVPVAHALTGRETPLRAALGLTPAESHLTALAGGPDPLLPDWDRFAAGDGIYLSSEAAARIGAEPGDPILIGGRALTLIGTFEGVDLDLGARDLDGTSLLPVDYAALPDSERAIMTRQDLEIMAHEAEDARATEEDLPHLRAADVAIVPRELIQHVHYSSLRSVAVAVSETEDVESLARAKAERIAYPVYFGDAEGVHALTTLPLSLQAPRSIWIPLGVGGLIIFNTMLSAIAERRRDIYVYTSLGLAPLHVGFLFLAEAVTYGLMGSIFGYVAGQGVATIFTNLGWMGAITMNYSGTQAILVMVLVLVVVILSSLIPAYLGGRMAAPSTERTWKVPKPDGDTICDTLPFTATAQTAPGLLCFLNEYFDAHRDGSIGCFSSDNLACFKEGSDGASSLGVRSTIWLAPFDLGIRQRATIRTAPSAEAEGIWDITIELHRESGQWASWWKLNRVFLGDVRKQLLGWRKLKRERIFEYIERGRRIVGEPSPTETNAT